MVIAVEFEYDMIVIDTKFLVVYAKNRYSTWICDTLSLPDTYIVSEIMILISYQKLSSQNVSGYRIRNYHLKMISGQMI